MAARAAAEMEAKARTEKERLTAADKTLPLPPVPSGKPSGYGVNRLPAAQDIFQQQEHVQDEENEGADANAEAEAGPVPRTPSLSALSILRPPLPRERPVFLSHGVHGEADSGLDALERRLVQQVGTRKHPILPPPDVRAVLSPMSTDTPPLPPVPVPLPVPGKSMAQEQPDDVGEGAAVNESAISSLALGAEEDFGGRKANIDVTPPSVGGEPEEEAEGDDADADGRTHRQGKGTGASSGSERGTHKARSRKSVKSDSKEKDREKDKERKGKKKKDKREVRDDDAVRLRRAAKGRVAEWLGNLEAHEPVPEPEVTSDVNPDLSLPRVEPAPAPEVDFASTTTAPVVVSQPNPHSSGFIPVATLRRAPISLTPGPAPVRRLAYRFPPNPAVEAKYDIKSARGGRGGQVTAVASIWAEATKATSAGTSTPTPPRAMPEGPNNGNAVRTARTRTAAANKFTSTPTPIKPMTDAKDEDKRALGTAAAGKERDPPRAPRARFGLGSAAAATPSSPALSSSIATPVLSSTASLARPPLSPASTPSANHSDSSPPSSQPLRPKPHPHPQSLTSSPAVGQQRPPLVNGGGFKTELAFGQARLRDLIKRYQGQAS